MAGKKGHSTAPAKNYPMVTVCTPTFNRRPFIQNMFTCFRNQDYPKHRIEWVIVDDGTDKIKDLVEKANIPQIRYFEVSEKMALGAKRNYMHSFARGSIIVYMDDDDYYPPERISHAVDKLQSNTSALCAGASEIYIYFKHIAKVIKCGPYGPNHATAGTFAFRTELLKITKYEEHAALAEEKAFLKDYTIPFVQLDPLKTILVFSHEHNTFDKRKMFDNPHPDFFRECDYTVETFIRKASERPIKQFFLDEIDKLLDKYEPGHPKMKPDVLKQIKEIEASRAEMIKQEMAKQAANGPIVLQQPGKEPVQLSQLDVVNIIKQQQEQLQVFATRNTELESMVKLLQTQIINKIKSGQDLIRRNTELENLLKSPPGELVNSFVPNDTSRVTELENVVKLLQAQMLTVTDSEQYLKKQLEETIKIANFFIDKSMENSAIESDLASVTEPEHESLPEPAHESVPEPEPVPLPKKSKSDPEVVFQLKQ